MKVILKHDAKDLGRAGEVIEVSRGYGRNWLLRRGLAELADPQTLLKLAREQEAQKRRGEQNIKNSQRLAARLQGKTFVFEAQTSDKGQLYGALKEKEILLKIRQSEGELPQGAKLLNFEPVKVLGEYELKIALTPDLVSEFKISVKAKHG